MPAYRENRRLGVFYFVGAVVVFIAGVVTLYQRGWESAVTPISLAFLGAIQGWQIFASRIEVSLRSIVDSRRSVRRRIEIPWDMLKEVRLITFRGLVTANFIPQKGRSIVVDSKFSDFPLLLSEVRKYLPPHLINSELL